MINRALWVSSVVLFMFGICLPMFTMQKFLIFNDTFSLLGGLYELLTSGEFFLFSLILVFSVLMPAGKFYVSFMLAFDKLHSPEEKLNTVKKMLLVGKWSMADVFVIAILASTIKVGGLAHVSVHIGLFVFCASALLTLVLSHRLMLDYELAVKAV
ncbi:paraquat-inducible protein A [Pseudoteredinibacter isoporae]|uniref:paraquat-inducible protein A n=1 Tax=Pseudoteredinibacter isoporae TaxID=570281 RepID=UPI0033407A8F